MGFKDLFGKRHRDTVTIDPSLGEPRDPYADTRPRPQPTPRRSDPSSQRFVGDTSQGSGRAHAQAYQPLGGSGRSDKKRLSLEKDIDDNVSDRDTAERLKDSLRRSRLTLDKFDLLAHMAMVALVFDVSWSMSDFFARGYVQRLAEEIQVQGLNFDDNGALDTFAFSNETINFGELSLANLEGFFSRHMHGRYVYSGDSMHDPDGDCIEMSGTDYYGALNAAFGLYKDRLKAGPANDGCDRTMPMDLIFVTDGGPNQGTHEAILQLLEEMADYPIFVTAICLRNQDSDFAFMKKLATKRGRMKVLNFGYEILEHPNNLAKNGDMGELLVRKYRNWIPEVKNARILLEAV